MWKKPSLPSSVLCERPFQVYPTPLTPERDLTTDQSNDDTQVQHWEPVSSLLGLFPVICERLLPGAGMTQKQAHHQEAHLTAGISQKAVAWELSAQLAGSSTGPQISLGSSESPHTALLYSL